MSTTLIVPSRTVSAGSGGLQAEWSTPRILRFYVIAVCGASLLLTIAALWGARSHRESLKTIGKDAAPSVIHAQRIGTAIAAMNTDVSNEFLSREDPGIARQSFEGHRRDATDALVTAAENITYGDAERIPIETIANEMERYDEAVQRYRDLRAAGGEKAAPDAYRAAVKILDGRLLPAAADLDKANDHELQQAYENQATVAGRANFFLTATGLVAGALLIGLQLFLASRTRRLLNPMLICATAIAFILTVNTLGAFRGADHELRVAKEAAYESIHALWLTRSVAYSARDLEGRYLLDPGQAAGYQESFTRETNEVAKATGDRTRASIIQELSAGGKAEGLTGHLADELKNVTFMGEREPAVETVDKFLEYVEADRRMRALEAGGKHAAALETFAGDGAGGAKQLFNDFDRALDATLRVNQREFDAALESGFSNLAGFEFLAPAGALAIALLTFLGVRPRLREYYA